MIAFYYKHKYPDATDYIDESFSITDYYVATSTDIASFYFDCDDEYDKRRLAEQSRLRIKQMAQERKQYSFNTKGFLHVRYFNKYIQEQCD